MGRKTGISMIQEVKKKSIIMITVNFKVHKIFGERKKERRSVCVWGGGGAAIPFFRSEETGNNKSVVETHCDLFVMTRICMVRKNYF